MTPIPADSGSHPGWTACLTGDGPALRDDLGAGPLAGSEAHRASARRSRISAWPTSWESRQRRRCERMDTAAAWNGRPTQVGDRWARICGRAGRPLLLWPIIIIIIDRGCRVDARARLDRDGHLERQQRSPSHQSRRQDGSYRHPLSLEDRLGGDGSRSSSPPAAGWRGRLKSTLLVRPRPAVPAAEQAGQLAPCEM